MPKIELNDTDYANLSRYNARLAMSSSVVKNGKDDGAPTVNYTYQLIDQYSGVKWAEADGDSPRLALDNLWAKAENTSRPLSPQQVASEYGKFANEHESMKRELEKLRAEKAAAEKAANPEPKVATRPTPEPEPKSTPKPKAAAKD